MNKEKVIKQLRSMLKTIGDNNCKCAIEDKKALLFAINKLEEKKIKMEKQKQQRDLFELSDGNLEVLINIPKMMRIQKYRNQLRKLTIDFLKEKTKRIGKIR